jgi:hypothetical protein
MINFQIIQKYMIVISWLIFFYCKFQMCIVPNLHVEKGLFKIPYMYWKFQIYTFF